ncbi:MAG TPA: cbb3-type cytochrome oxidase assembly protein CcoS [Vicinamibacterales bacterium]|nr:cbb3-type cytochrome oxidase assembly protein CcoS [Vicinamibacterales bacterium]
MSVIVLLIAAGGTVAAGFLWAFVWAVRSGQFDDTCTPAVRMLLDERTVGGARPAAATEETGRLRPPADREGR